ncbi:protein ATP6V1FNB [Rana temporaria]|uniref:protein ATP6V1FNB n=1 Tax=Rana temporaria TaxID=8407 RepID=UPI001AAD24DC|nr:protein ATP6V1FNB [Rana temporaria]
MAREFNLTTQKQDFLKECYLKEVLMRASWRHRYGQNLPRFANTKHNISVPKMKDHFKLPAISDSASHGSMDKKISGNSHENNQGPKDINKIDGGETTCFTDTVMRPASPGTLTLLYSGTSKEEQGRYHYMRVRNKLKPENKYTYPLISSWEYGWQMGSATKNNRSLYRRCPIVNDTFFRKNGIPCEPHPKDMAL